MNSFRTEERSKAEEQDNFFKVPMDPEDLNYENFEKGEIDLKNYEEYNSHNTVRLNVDETADLLKLPYIQENLND